MNRGHAATIVILFLLLSASTAHAFTFGPITTPFASTRGAQVEWQTNVSIETNSLKVRTNDIVIGSQVIDFQPDGAQRVRVYVERYSTDVKIFSIVMLDGAQTGINASYSNSGNDLTVSQGGETTHTCASVISPCSWVFTNSTKFLLTITTPAGVQQVSNETAPPASAGGGGGGGSSPSAPGSSAPEPRGLDDLPNPINLFPHLTALQWLVVILGTVLLFNGFPQTKRVLPGFLQWGAPPDVSMGVGAVLIMLVWLTPPN